MIRDFYFRLYAVAGGMTEGRKNMLELVTGGSGSGKSEYAESLAVNVHRGKNAGTLYYIATMYPSDEECLKRIEKHRRMRAEKGFVTIECYTHLEKVELSDKDVVLLECMSNLLANEMFGPQGRIKQESEKWDERQLQETILTPLFCLEKQAAHMVVVTNEVFSDGTLYEEETDRYVRLLGKANCEIGKKADTVTEVVCGIPVRRKGEGLCCSH